MGTTTIRVSEKTHTTLQALARAAGKPMAEIVEQAIEAYRRQRFVEAINAGYAELRADPDAWNAYQEELSEWDATLLDGLERDDAPTFARREHV
jgi:Ribbon-helix-helix protein, copG family